MKKHGSEPVRISQRSLVLLLAINLVVIAGLGFPFLNKWLKSASFSPTPTDISAISMATRTSTSIPSITLTSTREQTSTPRNNSNNIKQSPGPLSQGLILLSMADNGYTHLYGYQPQTIPFTRLTSQPWNDREPALNPIDQHIAFSSRQNGYWDLFTLDLQNGQVTRLTDTGDYDGSPSWSPDGKWLAYETYLGDRFQISVLDADHPGQPPSLVGDKETSNFSPSWSPLGHSIAYVKSSGTHNQLVIEDIDKPYEYFTPITLPVSARLLHPAWSPDGKSIAWAQWINGYQSIYIYEITSGRARQLGSGSWPVWSPDSSLVASNLFGPNQDSLIIYNASDGTVALPPQLLPGKLSGLDWKNPSSLIDLPEIMQQAERRTARSAIQSEETTPGSQPPIKSGLVTIESLSAPNPSLSNQVDKAFRTLRERLSTESGWDYLASVENAFVPLTSPLPPGLENDWLYTGRAFAGSPLPLNANWMTVLREDFLDQTYWRIFLKARYQDGSQGEPLHWNVWDLNARLSGDPQVYDEGGRLSAQVPPGYWVDMTSIANSYGWERLPALQNWKSFFPAALLGEFVYRQNLDWESAMLELYPAEALITSTPISYPLITPTLVPTWFRTRTLTPTPLPTITPTRRPTWTPLP